MSLKGQGIIQRSIHHLINVASPQFGNTNLNIKWFLIKFFKKYVTASDILISTQVKKALLQINAVQISLVTLLLSFHTSISNRIED